MSAVWRASPRIRSVNSHATNEHEHLLYPRDSSIQTSSTNTVTSHLNYHLPAHFIRLWLYLELCEDHPSFAVDFARIHQGHTAFATRLTNISPKEEDNSSSNTAPSLVKFEIGGGNAGGGSGNDMMQRGGPGNLPPIRQAPPQRRGPHFLRVGDTLPAVASLALAITRSRGHLH